MIDALFFDFDGLILDTETSDYESWAQIYSDHGVELPRETWLLSVGTDGSAFSPHQTLEQATGRSLDEAEVRSARRAVRDTMLPKLSPLPGVMEWITDARALGLRLAVVSSSERTWVEGHLARHDLRRFFDFVVTRDDEPRAKPYPDLYLRACAEAGTTSASPRAIALEDSPHGVSAAKAAGLCCVAVPGPMTRGQSFAHADHVLESLAAVRLGEMIERL